MFNPYDLELIARLRKLGEMPEALGALADEKANVDELDAWRTQTSAAFEREIFPGGHFAIRPYRTGFLRALSRSLAPNRAAL